MPRGADVKALQPALLLLLLLFVSSLEGGHRAAATPTMQTDAASDELPFGVWWFAPFYSGGGYSSEAVGFVNSLVEHSNVTLDLQLTQHGDAYSRDYFDGLDEKTQRRLYELSSFDPSQHDKERASAVVICHSEPGAWSPALYSTTACPPSSPPFKKPRLVIGRTTFETDRLSPVHVERCNKMDEVWVPTEFNRATFIQSGVEPSKIFKVPEPVEVEFFDPAVTAPLKLPIGKLVFGREEAGAPPDPPPFRFLSVFKWEPRKGWEVLLRAYLREFAAAEGVTLHLLTNAYHARRTFERQMRKIAKELSEAEGWGERSKEEWPKVYLIDRHVPTVALPQLYKAMDAFVLASRGEGWGRPHTEAMAMGLPIIATNWSGPTEYMTPANSYPLRYDGLSEIPEGAFKGHMWADPSEEHLRELMRLVTERREEAAAKGAQARRDIVERYSPEATAKFVMSQLRRIAVKTSAPGSHDEL
mmetsp:Transcript_27542/g.60154  ORF Transcript_27542/g.60154 Transcript_27542/m.60154 type:complete len:473 (-) Transcript_27542:185-1603(-)|eukprot:CAMPEP_0118944034 /NCGR_PEP_ID=MMETSP1169-20130426/39543_1 /TAXON_ID=36882 /ORGANISM="Pyramimonas obovata, Strain CCMP722" /LENGTH=472 /DNA_ID=CAMNT_0006889439 /DNA_START=77 /DNA_END=1495 /DNA_ORIENTATION=+